ncbi:Rid family hydrolase [Streptomyces sp. NPDC048636]|uniref:RidA family protein n=1 Tax=Streptomyces sp. NPDC048636 TaxID=3155762 RepID=UPI0034206512
MPLTTIATTAAPEPVGAYSQGRRIGPFLQVSGQLATDPSTGTLLAADVAGQTRRVLEQAQAVLAAESAGWQDVLMVRVFLASDDDDDFEAMDSAYRGFLAAPFPPRTTVTAGLAPGALIEIDVLAVRPPGGRADAVGREEHP